MTTKGVPLNFKVDQEVKDLLDQLVVFQTIQNNKKSTQKSVFIEALVVLMNKYKIDMMAKNK